MSSDAASMENSMEVPQKTINRTTIWSSNSTAEYIFKENKNTNSKKYMHATFIKALFTVASIWKQPKCLWRWKDKDVEKVYTYTEK